MPVSSQPGRLSFVWSRRARRREVIRLTAVLVGMTAAFATVIIVGTGYLPMTGIATNGPAAAIMVSGGVCASLLLLLTVACILVHTDRIRSSRKR